MFHRFLILLIVGWQFAGQLANVPHVHAGMGTEERQQLGQTPHVHFPMLGGSVHDHGFHHEHGSHHAHDFEHEHACERDVKNAPCQHDEPSDEYEHSHDDCGVIFVEAHDGVVTNKVIVERSSLGGWNLPLSLAAVDVHPVSIARVIRTSHALDEIGDGSDVYLTLRNLRI